jgi:hypothetical protein
MASLDPRREAPRCLFGRPEPELTNWPMFSSALCVKITAQVKLPPWSAHDTDAMTPTRWQPVPGVLQFFCPSCTDA